ncbi:GtrA family protein [Legionella sp. 16cNR16C]|uniref:GtrA family protein n=1 Tax=Legionella sp. 16cNR16C TaxID=2905656 RepID=UPI001E35A652|nr:GtrA family protein [Legionella sp. 16cNR16C]MCE3046355.1 GtrA family protein [Legionella sp. 16cNR16C]
MIKRWLLFGLGGGLTTSFTYLIYLSLNHLIDYQWAYFIGYFLGVLLAYWFNTVIVFKAELHWKGLFTYPLIYVLQYLISAALLGTLVEQFNISQQLAPLLVIAAMVPLTYFLNKLVIGLPNKRKSTHLKEKK